MINLKNYSKTRGLFSWVFVIFIIYGLFQIIINYFNPSSNILLVSCNPCKSQFQIFKEYLEPFLL